MCYIVIINIMFSIIQILYVAYGVHMEIEYHNNGNYYYIINEYNVYII